MMLRSEKEIRQAHELIELSIRGMEACNYRGPEYDANALLLDFINWALGMPGTSFERFCVPAMTAHDRN